MKRRKSLLIIILGILLFIYAVSLVIPMAWGLLSSVKIPDDYEFKKNLFGFPTEFYFSNYSTIWQNFYMNVEKGATNGYVYVETMLLNSVLYAGGSALVQATVQFVMAYVAARFSFKLGKVIHALVIIALVTPIVGSNSSALALAETFNLKNSILGMYIMKGYFLGIYFLIMYETLRNFPMEYTEAACIDGASNFNVMTRVIFPLSVNVYFTIVLLLFVGFWNDYTTPMLFMPSVPTLSYGLYYISSKECVINAVKPIPVRLAACILMLIPSIAVFIVFHDRLMGNVSIGGLKG